jgi:hypothetical protein
MMIAPLAALTLAIPAGAQEQTRTRTYDGPNVSAVQTTTVNPETGTATRDGHVTNLNTGNTASSSAERQRTDSGAAIEVVQTGPQGNSRSLSGERTRTANGSTFSGAATGAGGETYGLQGSRSRAGRGNSQASQSITNSAGDVLASRSRSTTRAPGQVNRSVARSRRPRG